MRAIPSLAVDPGATSSSERPELFAACNGLDICYQTFGEAEADPLLLIMGLGGQMITWPDEFCQMLAETGFYVVRFDNRDCGRSTHLDRLGVPSLGKVLSKRVPPAYTLDNMADDVVGLLDHLELRSAHVVGASLGGMVAQTLALKEPGRVRSLTSVMSSTGSRFRGQASLALLPRLLSTISDDRATAMSALKSALDAARSPSYAPDREWTHQMLELTFDRGFSSDGLRRQLAAALSAPNRTRALARITQPTLVVHGAADRLISVSGGRATARAIPSAYLLELAGMGHDLPRDLWHVIVTSIRVNAERVRSGAVER